MRLFVARLVRCNLAIAFTVLAGPAALTARGADLRPRPIYEKPVEVDVAASLPGVVTVRFHEGTTVVARDGSLTDLGTGALDAAAREALAALSAGRWEPSYRHDAARLTALRDTAQRRLGRAVADPNVRFNYLLPPGADLADVVARLNALVVVELALPFPRPVEPPLPPNFQPNQGYENPGPVGVGAETVWAGGVTGLGVRIVDLEYDWNLNHLDLPPVTLLGFPPVGPFGNDHGTAVLGEVGGVANGWGITGIAHGAALYVHGVYNGVVYDVGAAIIDSLNPIGPGDVMIIEQQISGPNGPGAYVPVEWFQPWYEDIVTAVGNGVILVEAAGNGSQDLDSPIFSVGNGGHWPFLPENDSGAIIVGAGAAGTGGSDVPGSRLWYSNYGSTVDLQGWGESVWTTGYGDAYASEGPNLYYTAGFGGTSSASPIVAGACALVQSAYEASNGSALTPAELKSLMQQTGWPQTSGTYPESQNIGPRCDAERAIEEALCLTTDSFRLIADETGALDEFGHAVAASGDRVLVGAVADGASGAGAAYVFDPGGSAWSETTALLAADGAAGDAFGYSAALHGDLAVVGAPNHDDQGTNAGAAYVFRFDGESWLQEQKLLAPDGLPGDEFGSAVALGADVVAVGAPANNSPGADTGAVYVYRFDGASWSMEQKLTAADGAAGDELGDAVALDGPVLLAGARRHDEPAADAGAAYVYRFDGASWTQEQKLTADDSAASDLFGAAVAIEGETAMIGAIGDDDLGSLSGSVYVFASSGGDWAQTQKVQASDGLAGDTFGFALSMHVPDAVIGAYRADDHGLLSGKAYRFQLQGGSWVQQQVLLPSDVFTGDQFGFAVALAGGTPIVGAAGSDQYGEDAGAVYALPEQNPFDCNGNGVQDACDIAAGTSDDADGDGVPDECQCPWDCQFVGNGAVGIGDLLALLAQWGLPTPCDFDGDGVSITDLLELLSHWGPCR